jgi:hypothetical protein
MGIKITMGEQEWYVPPLTLKQLKDNVEAIELVRTARLSFLIEQQEIDAVCTVAAAALSRNYPDISVERVADMIDLGNLQAVVTAIMTGTGLQPMGEAEPVAKDSASANG